MGQDLIVSTSKFQGGRNRTFDKARLRTLVP